MSVTSRKTVCFVVSDFFDEGYLRSMQSANRKHDVIGVLITDPAELRMPNVGMVTLADPEQGTTQLVDSGSSAFRRELAHRSDQRVEELRHAFGRSGIDFIHLDASGSIVDPLVKFFRMRERRMHR